MTKVLTDVEKLRFLSLHQKPNYECFCVLVSVSVSSAYSSHPSDYTQLASFNILFSVYYMKNSEKSSLSISFQSNHFQRCIRVSVAETTESTPLPPLKKKHS